MEEITNNETTQNIKEMIRAVHLLGESDPKQAFADAEKLNTDFPDNLLLLAELVHLSRKIGDKNRTIEYGIKAINQALIEDNGELTRRLYLSFGDDRYNLPVEAKTLDHMVKFFIPHEEFLDASWVAYRSAILDNDTERAQKRVMEIGDLAAQQGHPQCAVKIYKFYLAQHPHGILSEYAHKAIEFQERQLQRISDPPADTGDET